VFVEYPVVMFSAKEVVLEAPFMSLYHTWGELVGLWKELEIFGRGSAEGHEHDFAKK
jgi:hypothetical protein